MADARPERIVVASGNAHKVVELRAMLQHDLPELVVVGMTELGDAPSIAETADDFEGNARLKSEGIAAWLRELGYEGDTAVLADDSGVCVEALDGAPGVHSARFAGDDATDDDNNRRLVRELTSRGLSSSPGHYACVLALTRADGRPWPGTDDATMCFFGRWDVSLDVQPRGDGGFGYDPHAWLLDGTRTVAELAPDEKAAQSHRGQAFRALAAWLSRG